MSVLKRVFVLFLLFQNTAESQSLSVSNEYERKSITIVPRVVLLGKTELPNPKKNALLSRLERSVRYSRYHYFDLPAETVNQFDRDGGGRAASFEAIEAAIRKRIVPVMVSLLRAREEALASTYQSEADRQSFISTKARELGIDSKLLERVYDLTLIGVPYVDAYAPESSSQQEAISGGIVWYRLEASGDSISCGFEGVSAAQSASHTRGSWVQIGDAITSLAGNLEVSMRELPAFRMESQILAIDGGTLMLTIGRTDGLSVDDKFYIVEDKEASSGGPRTTTTRGWARVTKIMKDTDIGTVRSRAKIVSGSHIARGMRLREIPTSRWEAEIGFVHIPYRISSGLLRNGENVFMEIGAASERSAKAIQVGLNYDMGVTVRDPLVFAGVHFAFGLTNMGGVFHNRKFREDHTLVFAGDLSWTQRFYWRVLGVELGGKFGGIYLLNLFKDSVETNGIRESSIEGSAGGLSLEGGMSYWVNPHLTLRLLAERRFYGKPHWAVSVNKKNEKIIYSEVPELEFDPLCVRLLFAWNLARI